MDRYRLEWRAGPRLVGGDTYVIDLALLRNGHLAKIVEVVLPVEDAERAGLTPPIGWRVWRALVEVAAGRVVRAVGADRVRFEAPRTPLQVAPELGEVMRRSRDPDTLLGPARPRELVSVFEDL